MKKLFIVFSVLFILCFITLLTQKENNQAVGQCYYEQAEKAGCCSRHGGVCGCNEDYHKLKCCDGSLSPGCGC